MTKKIKDFLKIEFVIHFISFFIFLLSSCFLVQTLKIGTWLTILVSLICLASSATSIIFEIVFYEKNKMIDKKMRIIVFFSLMIVSGILITVIFLIINQFTYSFTRTSWIAPVMIISLSSATFGISYI